MDVSKWLAKGGFLPVPIIIPEPAVDNGAGLVLAFIGKSEPGSGAPPSFTGLAFVRTGNESEVAGVFHEDTYLDNRLKISGYAAKAWVNLDFYAGNIGALPYNIDGDFAKATATYRIGQSPWYAGGSWVVQNSVVTFEGPGATPFPPGLSNRLSGIGPVLEYYSLDNTFTPTSGISARIFATAYDEAIGSDVDFDKAGASIFAFTSPTERLKLGGKFMVEPVSDGAPFYALPSISLRGIPAARYQGQTAISTEAEATYQFANRWRVVGFGGVGWNDHETAGADRSPKLTFGAGLRYRIARLFGADLGFDIARGPEDTVHYIQFGRAWRHF